MKPTALFLIPLLFIAPLCRAETGIDHLFSLDLGYSVTGLLNQGWGIGASYEKKLLNYLSVKGTMGHMTFLTGIRDIYCTSVNISLFVNYYPFGNGLDKLYIGLGSGGDFMHYFGSGEVPINAGDVLISLTPRMGWKWTISTYCMVDISAGYKVVAGDDFSYRGIKDYTKTGPQFGLSFKLFFEEIFKKRREK
ncbi:MAG: hypothetical protein LBK25_06600 [Treponema sp.]|jgi:hypothetical protein|nr:hypothetical protein [Treponema sp.]